MVEVQTQDFIQRKFSEYYRQSMNSIHPPVSIKNREFAFVLFRQHIMLRHLGFTDADAFRTFLVARSPCDVYYSSAYYENPEVEMSAKGWVGADLIFDIDADHIPTPCDRQHDTWTCKSCGASGRGTKPRRCPKCKDRKLSSLGWPCDVCLESAKKEAIRLTEILEADFGFSLREMTVGFSGHRGYHVHVENEDVKALDAMSRSEVVDYLSGTGLEPRLHYFDTEKALGPGLEESGWRGRIAKGTYELLASTEDQLRKEKLSTISKSVSTQREETVDRWREKGPWGLVKGVGQGGWNRMILQAIENQSAKIDTVVTTDVHRLIRLGNTLHGETGLKKVDVPINRIEAFDPFKDAIAFRNGEVTVDASESPKFRLEDRTYGPYKNERIELPISAALLLLCKGAARIPEESDLVQ